MKILIIANDPPYGSERSYNAFRLALKLVKTEGDELRLFLMADAVFCGIKGQTTPEGYYNVERMLKGLHKAEIKACGTCMKARGLTSDHLLPHVQAATMNDLAEWVRTSDQVVTF